ncbi:LysM peptidoglycan-binding domain-containing protein [Alkalibacillus aidingensis]|uniref:LysM peptidoglycan-binding domain-containing protein n=1 Tax=Alkalibacillus aidingensis TaxID=2747607 RepID=UPI00166118F9|nr:LysM peptidoglycan-binding domain-containing protein [Alkalibacillus aidingensis]
MKIHIVKKGETMASIANSYGITESELHQMNKQLRDPKDLLSGMKLKVPKDQSPKQDDQTTDSKVETTLTEENSEQVVEEVSSENTEEVAKKEEAMTQAKSNEPTQQQRVKTKEDLPSYYRLSPPPSKETKPKPIPFIREDEQFVFDKEIKPYNEDQQEKEQEELLDPSTFYNHQQPVTYWYNPVQEPVNAYYNPNHYTNYYPNRSYMYYPYYQRHCGCTAAPMNYYHYGYMRNYY